MKNARGICVVLCAVFFLPLFLEAQSTGSLQGRIVDPDGKAIAGASIRLYSRSGTSTMATRSDQDGIYVFETVAVGGYVLEAEAAGAALRASRSIRVGRGESELDIELIVIGPKTQVMVTASSTPLVLEEISKAMDVTEADEISQRVEFSIPEAIRHTPGLRVRQHGGPGSFTTVQARGLRDADTAVLIDGLRFRDAAGAQGDATSFYEDLIVVDHDRVEVLRGSGSSLYGSHAMGAVLNIESSRGGGEPHGEISGEGGGLGMFRGVARLGGGLANDRFTYSGGVAHVNVTEGVDGFDPYRNTSGQGYARYHFTPSVSLSGRVWGGDTFLATNESPTVNEAVLANHPGTAPVTAIGLPDDQLRRFARARPFDPGSATFIQGFNDPDNHRVADFLTGALILTHEVSPNRSYRLSFHHVGTDRSFRDGPAGRNEFDPIFSNDSRFEGRTDTFQARTDQWLGEHNLVMLGYEFEREEYRDFNTDENPDPSQRPNSGSDLDQRSHSFFAQDQIRLAEGRLQLSLSGRLQAFDLGDPEFTGNQNPYGGVDLKSPKSAYTGDAAIAYFFRSSGTKVRAHVGNAYRAPASFERFGATFFQGSASFWGDPMLNPERAIAFDGGIDQWLANSKVRLSGTFFYTRLQEVIVFDFGVIDPTIDSWGRFGGYRNTGGGLARGAEFSASLSPMPSLHVTTSYTYTNSDSRKPTVPGEDFFKNLGVSDHIFSVTATQRLGRRFDVTFDLFAASEYPLVLFGSPNRLQFDGPLKADLVTSYSVPIGDGKELRFYGKVENVFDHRYFENGFAAPGLWGLGGLKFSF